MQTIGAHMNNAASAAIEGKKTMQKDLGRGGPKAMAWFFFPGVRLCDVSEDL